MLTLRGRAKGRSNGRGDEPRPASATAASVVVHVLLLAVLWQALQMPTTLRQFQQMFFTRAPEVDQPRERIRFLTTSPPREPSEATLRTPVRSTEAEDRGGATRAGKTEGRETPAEGSAPPAVTVVAPTDVPTGIAPSTGGGAESLGPAGGPLASGRGALRGIQPGYADPRVWVAAPALEYAPKSDEERLDSAVTGSIMRYRDSVMANSYSANRFERGDWTYRTKGGDRYGVDQQFIRLGKVSIPTALLGLLPLNQLQGNPVENDRQARLAAMRYDIIQGAQAAMNEEEFRQAVKAIRARKEKERKAQEKLKKQEQRTISNP